MKTRKVAGASLGLLLAACAPATPATTRVPAASLGSAGAAAAPRAASPCDEGMQAIPAATFTMLADARSVTLPTFCIDRTEVTVKAYKACVDARACTTPAPGNWGQSDTGQHPINGVDWFQASAYCSWSGKRLPSEEEWEHAASGDSPRDYPWGNEPVDGRVCMGQGTCPVGSHPGGDSPFGVKDMAGNVWEWTSSGSAAHRIIRGGPFYGDASAQRVRVRITDADSAHGTDSASGFRCARSEPSAR